MVVANSESALSEASFCTGRPFRRSSLVSSSRPTSLASSRRSRENHWRIFERALEDPTMFSQSLEGPAVGALEVKISTVSADERRVSRGTNRPLTLAPYNGGPPPRGRRGGRPP